MRPAVTAVLPLHNHRSWIGDAVRSVASQDYERLRLVVVDDGSADGSSDAVVGLMQSAERLADDKEPAVVRGLIDGRQAFLLRFAQAKGPSFARNAGMKLLWDETDVFALLDSDDIYEAGKISKSVDVLVEHPEVGVVYSDYDTLRPDGLRVRQYKEPYSRERLVRECIINCDSLARKAALAETGVFDVSLRTVEDYDLWLRLTERALAWHIPESLVTIRVGAHSSSATVSREGWQANYRRVFEKLRERGG